jgi:hypothetical protein
MKKVVQQLIIIRENVYRLDSEQQHEETENIKTCVRKETDRKTREQQRETSCGQEGTEKDTVRYDLALGRERDVRKRTERHRVVQVRAYLDQGILKGEVSLYC